MEDYSNSRKEPFGQPRRRKFRTIRKQILSTFDGTPKTVNEIAEEIHANWLTTKRHLVWLEKYQRKVRIIKKKRGLTLYQLWQR